MKRQRNAASSALMRQATGPTGIEAERAASASHPKWQVQNRVGGGSLYGIADASPSRAFSSRGGASLALHSPLSPDMREGSAGGMRSSSGGLGSLGAATLTTISGREQTGGGIASESGPTTPTAGRGKIEGIDIVYLKNVLLKFMEAAVTGKVAERDVLLPAVAAILQASPAEFAILKKMFVNTTTPPAMQMLSVFGIKMS